MGSRIELGQVINSFLVDLLCIPFIIIFYFVLFIFFIFSLIYLLINFVP